MIIRLDFTDPMGGLKYNFKKLELGPRNDPEARIIGGTIPYLNKDRSQVLSRLNTVANLNQNPRLKHKVCHIKIALSDKDRKVSDFEFEAMSKDVLLGLNFIPDKHASIIYRHYDTKSQHCHLIISRTSINGKTNPLKFHGYTSKRVARELEKKYDLIVADKKEGMREAKFFERKSQKKRNMQSDLQRLRDIVSHSLNTSPTLKEYFYNLARNNVEVNFRIEKKRNDKGENIMVGISYGLSSTDPNIKMRRSSLPRVWNRQGVPETINNISWDGYHKSKGEKCYIDTANIIHFNTNPYPVIEMADCKSKATNLGPDATWHGLTKKYKENLKDELFDTLLSPDSKAKKRNRDIWEFKINEVIPPESEAVKKAMLGISEANLGYIQEAIDAGVTFGEVYEQKKGEIKDSNLLNSILAYKWLEENTPTAERSQMLLGVSLVKYRFEKTQSVIVGNNDSDESAYDYALGIISHDVEEIELALTDRNVVPNCLELTLEPSTCEEERVEEERTLLYYFFEREQERLRDMLRNPKFNFLPLRDKMDPITLEYLKLDETLSEDIKIRIETQLQHNTEIVIEPNRTLNKKINQKETVDKTNAIQISKELVLEPGRGKSLLDYFLEANEEKLREAVLNPKIDFSDIKDYLDEEYVYQKDLPDAILELAEKRIAKEIELEIMSVGRPTYKEVAKKVDKGNHRELRYLVHTDLVDFKGQSEVNADKLIDRRVADKVTNRIKTDRDLIPKYIKKDNQDLTKAIQSGNADKVMLLMEKPFISFAYKNIQTIENQLSDLELFKLQERISLDESRAVALLNLEAGKATVDRETGEIVSKSPIFHKKETKQHYESIRNMAKGQENKKGVGQRYNPTLELRPPWDQDPRRW